MVRRKWQKKDESNPMKAKLISQQEKFLKLFFLIHFFLGFIY